MALLVILAVAVLLFVAIELGLRSLFGFGNPLIYIRDENIGYLLAPNQETRRFGNRIAINEYSMRSAPINPTPASSTLRVLLLGDSIANGGWWTPQTQTISSLMMDSLAAAKPGNYREVEVLNASANSWSPRNELAYLQKFGNFHAQALVLLINTDDLFAMAPTSLVVGRDRNYPDHQPPLAIVEVLQRYAFKQKPIPEIQALHDQVGDCVGVHLEAISEIQTLTHQSNSQFLLAMTPLLREISESGSRDYEIVARQRLRDFTKAGQITYIDFLPIFQATTNPQALYKDHIHLNSQGNQLVSKVIERSLLEILKLV
ncbi:lysophospholipase L1-like esterase [Cylindrospermum stagnale PCC 7417]|uniref:Lysophospholipase L1-like esterase n=1 Tax=Cylindrospermum stagnale PCC 7417 TaxID=56107 RepID=K9WTW9_9NOST|nr:lysophospholipase L1-like esterase [Cylindrospermum stagnale PCC 7417]